MTGAAARGNIGPVGRRRRALSGGVVLALGLVGAAVLIALSVDRAWRWTLFPVFLYGMLGLLQAREST